MVTRAEARRLRGIRTRAIRVTRRAALQGAMAAALGLALKPRRAFSRRGRGVITLPANPIGMNLAAGGAVAFSYEGQPIFKNRVREGRGFTQISSNNTSVALDSGWPTTDWNCTLIEGQLSPSWLQGTFKCGFKLRNPADTPTVASSGQTTISNVVNTAGTVTFDMVFSAGATIGGFNVTGTTQGAYDIFAYLPAYPGSAIDDPTQDFTNEIIAFLKQYRLLRVMQAQGVINNTLVQTSALRNTVSNCQSRPLLGGRATITLTAAPPSGATSATMTSAWPLASGQYGIGFPSSGNTCGRVCTLTSGSTAITWSSSQAFTEAGTATYTNAVGGEGFPAEWWIGLCKKAGIGIWLCLPLLEDGTNYAAGSYTSAVMDLINSMGFTNEVLFETSNEIWNYHAGTLPGIIGFLGFTGSNAQANYMGYRMHAVANLGRTKFGAAWGTRVKQVLAWQSAGNGLAFFHTCLSYMATNYGTVSNDLSYLAIAPYCTPNIGNTDTISTIEGYITNGQNTSGSDGARQTLRMLSENIAATAMFYGLGLVAYECGIQWNAVNQNNANVGAAIMDAGMTSAIETYYTGLRDTPYIFACHFNSGVSNQTGNAQPEDELSNNYANFESSGSPTQTALLAYTGGFIPQRNVVNNIGDFIDCINYTDNNSTLSGTYPYFGQLNGYNLGPHYGTGGYLSYTFYCAQAGTIGLQLTVNATAAGATDVEVNGTVVASNVTIPNSAGVGTVNLGNITVNKGWNYICLGRAGVTQSGITPQKITRTS